MKRYIRAIEKEGLIPELLRDQTLLLDRYSA